MKSRHAVATVAILFSLAVTTLLACSHSSTRESSDSWVKISDSVSPDLPLPTGPYWGDLTDMFSIANRNTIMHSDGKTWSTFATDLPDGLNGISGNSSSDIFVVGDHGTIVHYDGSTWQEMVSNTDADLSDVWAVSFDDVFAVGKAGTALLYDGQEWEASPKISDQDLNALWADSASDVFAVGDGGTIVHFDGNTWTTMESGTIDDITSIWGDSVSRVWVQTSSELILQYDGSAWSIINWPGKEPVAIIEWPTDDLLTTDFATAQAKIGFRIIVPTYLPSGISHHTQFQGMARDDSGFPGQVTFFFAGSGFRTVMISEYVPPDSLGGMQSGWVLFDVNGISVEEFFGDVPGSGTDMNSYGYSWMVNGVQYDLQIQNISRADSRKIVESMLNQLREATGLPTAR